jgi:DNA-directed RNA polymerase subunit RPC12/RpoP
VADLRNQLVPDVQVHKEKKVECLGIVFESDEKRGEYFAGRLMEALNELEEKLSGVAFKSVDDIVERLSSLSKWPMGDAGQVRSIARRMRYSEPQKDLLQRWKDEVGFPHGSIEDIMRLSDPPYYTACPNPFVQDFVKCHSRPYDPDEKYHREPFAADVSEGKNDPIYNAHSYHTKVPHKAIMRYILHYTEPGDIVFDGFCGTGMTGVAAQLCGDRRTVESLGYRVERDGTVLEREEGDDGKAVWKPFSRLGPRKAILNDLSPAATFIAYNYNTPVDVKQFEREAKRILAETEKECGWMYATLNTEGIEISKETVDELASKVRHAKSVDEVKQIIKVNSKLMGKINYTVWSDVFVCPNCSKEIVFWKVAVDKEAGKVKDVLSCPHCRKADLRKRDLERAWVTTFDKGIGKTINQTIQVPVMVNYTAGKRRFEKAPDSLDMAIIQKIEEFDIPYWYPNWPMMFKGEQWGDSWRAGYHAGITHVHHFYSKRNLWVLGCCLLHTWKARSLSSLFLLSSLSIHLNKMRRFQPAKPGGTPGLAGTLYISSIPIELSFFDGFPRKMRDVTKAIITVQGSRLIGTGSAAECWGTDRCYAEYIFTDPPFGSNLMYSELNFLWESWLRVFTNNKEEAIENKVQGKGLVEYQEIMERCFKEYYRVLKPGRWMTVEFHNSRNSVWNAIQEALGAQGLWWLM